jgi:hypothetical protein
MHDDSPTPDEIKSFHEILKMTTMKQTWIDIEITTELKKENCRHSGMTNLELLRSNTPTFGFF